MPDDSAAELETLLSEYEESSGAPESTPNAEIGKLAKTIQPVVDFVKKQEGKEAKAEFDADVKDILGFFSEDEELKKLPEQVQRGFIETHAQDTPDFNTAFENRAKDSKAWDAARETARDAFTELASKLPGSTIRSDVEAAKAAVDGTTDKPVSDDGPSPVKKMRMSDYEWSQYKEEQEARAEA